MTEAFFAGAARAAVVGLMTIGLVAGCSSTTSGSGSTGNGGGGNGGGGGGFGTTKSSPAPGGGGGGGTSTGSFCHDWSTISSDLGSVAGGNIQQKLVEKFDALSAEAPSAVKSDVQLIDAYVHGLVSGSVDSSKAKQFARAFEHVGVWVAQNC